MDTALIYLDNAATSFPKPESVYAAVNKALREECGNPGRSGHRLSLAAGRIIDDARMLCAQILHAPSPDTIVFTHNTTTALNIAIKGILSPGDHVLTTSLEHNSVTRPLYALQDAGIEVTKLPTDVCCGADVSAIAKALRRNTKLIICTHISNVTGTQNDIAAIGAFCREHGVTFLVDSAQSAGSRRIDVQDMRIDMLAFPGHKGLFGPQGTGGLYIRPGLALRTILQGGTGSASESLAQPETLPARFENGTLNTPGLAGLAAGIRFVLEQGVETIERREAGLINRLLEGIDSLKGVRIIGPGAGRPRGSVVSVYLDAMPPLSAACIFDSSFCIAVRSGLHCASDAHRSLGTLEQGGTLRISPGYWNTNEDIDKCLQALEFCAKGI